MRLPPYYPQPPKETPINWKRWIQSLLFVITCSLLITNIFWPESKPIKTPLFWSFSLVFPLIIYTFIFSIYVFINRLMLYSRDIHIKKTTEDEGKWWQYQSAYLPIIDVIIIGCLGSKQNDWSMLIRNNPVPPLPIKENEHLILRCPLLLGNKINRDEILAKSLANKIVEKFENIDSSIKCVFWLGSEHSMNVFIECLQEDNKLVIANKIPISSINDLDNIIDNYHEIHWGNGQIIVAGTNLSDEDVNPLQSETGFVWLVSHLGKYKAHRCEITNGRDETTFALTKQLERYASLTESPSLTIAMDNESATAFISTDWNATEHILSPYYGEITRSSPFIAISQVIMHCIQNNIDSNGWVSSMPDNQYIAGVVTRYEQK
ncbi:hypothetical protein C9446_09820 [Providencia heimbachae]|uniref:hypothetical protein n=1 Tax=Providencia heimbachae TaxID=333962 RepID=UPI0010BF19D2|nr:hypothetical protein C9446_09820 [Providencia heimbachae]